MIDLTTAVINQALRAARPLAAAFEGAQALAGPAPDLEKIALDDELSGLLNPPLSRLGFELAVQSIPDRFGSGVRTVSRASNHSRQIYFAAIPREVLEGEGRGSIDAVNSLIHTFPKNSTVYFISRGLDVLDLFLKDLLNEWRELKGIQADLIPWKHINKLRAQPNEGTRVRLVQVMLGLPEAPEVPEPAVTVKAATALRQDEKDTVIDILIRQAGDPFSRPQDVLQDLVSAAGIAELGSFAGRWTGDVGQDVRKLLAWATDFKKEFPAGHERAGQTTIGWLLKAVLDKQPAPEDEAALVKMIVDHGLIRDTETLGVLLRKHKEG